MCDECHSPLMLFAEVLTSQQEFAQRAVPHRRRIRPPMEVLVAHDWKTWPPRAAAPTGQIRRTARRPGLVSVGSRASSSRASGRTFDGVSRRFSRQ